MIKERSSRITKAAAALVGLAALAAAPVPAQVRVAKAAATETTEAAPAPATDIPRMPDGKPDFSGYWKLPYFPNMARTKEQEAAVPYTQAGLEAYRNHDSKDDPTARCLYPGVPRIMDSPYPMQIIQTKDFVVMAFEYMQLWRVIPTDHQPHPSNLPPSLMGNSVGWWEGDTFVIDTTGLMGSPWTWLDTAGHQHSDQLHVIERLQRPSKDQLTLDFTVEDPVMYAKPWHQHRVITPLAQTPGLPMLLEYSCNENNKDLQHLISTKPALGR
jgi:hypothetical protein